MSIKKFIFISLFFSPLLALAQNQAVLPKAGFTPESPFYFLDKLGETIREFFTFNQEGKARLQITFAAERIAEIKVILETKEVEAKGLDVALSRLKTHIAKSADIIEREKNKGKNVSRLAKDLNDDFGSKKEILEQAFEGKGRVLEARVEELKGKIREARKAGDAAQVEALTGELDQIKAQKELLEQKEEEQDESLEKEEEKIEKEMEDKDEAEEAIREAEEKNEELVKKAEEDGIEMPKESLEKFEKLLNQAKELFEKGNYQGAEQLAEQAEKSLEKLEKAAEELEEAKEKEEDLKDEQEEGEKEATEEKRERLKEEVEKAKEETRKAEDKLRQYGEEEEEND